MGDGFNVNVDEVRTHAQTVGDIAATVRSVAGGARDSVSGGAFGQIAEFFASAITGAADVVRQSVNHAGETVDQVRSGLNLAADGYQTIEDKHVSVFSTTGPFATEGERAAQTSGTYGHDAGGSK
jgi:methyl-accepting chemotaxis protein